MKKVVILGLLVMVFAKCFSQTDELNSATKSALTGTPANGKGNDRALFPVFFSGFVNLLQTDGKNDIVVNPTLYSIFGHDSKLENIQHYRESNFLRNVSLLGGFTPDSKNQLHVDDGLLGVKWIIINNKILKEKDYNKAVTTAKLVGSVNAFVMKLPGGPKFLQKYITQTDTVNNLIKTKDPSEIAIVKKVANQFHVDETEAANLINGSFAIQGYLLDRIATKSALNFAYSQTYDFQKWQSSKLAFSSDYSFFIGKIPFDLTGSLTFASDSTKLHSTLLRTIYEVDFGKNITFDEAKWLEVKPAVSYVHTDGPLYKKEKEDNFAASVTPRFKINKNFWFPITIKYDPKGWFGYMTVQYALK